MKVEINQSNKIEQTNKDTIIGLADDKIFTVLIKAKIKRKLQEEFKKQGKPRLFVYRTFVAGIILVFRYAQLKNLSRVVIDEEYYGKDKLLKSIFLEMWSKYFTEVPEVCFERIGKKAKVHNVCYFTMKRKYRPDRVISFKEIRYLVLK